MAKQSQSEIDQMIQRSQCINRDLVRRDIIQVFQSYQCNLILKLNRYNLNKGNSKEYLCLCGTVLCEYKGNRYNIPIEINLNENHPYKSPIAQVKPTSNMFISSTNKDVQSDGTITINYLKTWRHPTSDLSNLINAMSQSFSLSPPVYSISNINQPTTPYPTNISSMPMPMGMISSYSHSNIYSGIDRGNQGEISQDIYHQSLKTAVLDKIRNRLNELKDIEKVEFDSLKQTEQYLNDGEKKLQSLINQIQQKQIQTENYITSLQNKTNQISQKSFVKKDNSIENDAIIFPAPIYKKLFQIFAEEHAVQDLLYYLTDGLRKRSISLDNYLKHIRELSRKQFILRATMIKCRQVAGLPIK
ncbi:unnamed protein product [Rotaria sordida]|uniref:Tumor susceptibility gene 101 protein n=1 Tax=Rotaria sordida TaxID=392033 RepID=A0A813SW64_9BILA|nr:unnamed protein product [Rotaria sordida]